MAIAKILCLLFGILSAVTGLILGARALNEIRRSGGVKTGLGSAIFATVAWPILFLLFLASVPLQIRMPLPGDGPHLGPFAVIFVVLFPVLAAAWLLVRSLYRWAGGVERKDGTRFYPGLGMPLLMVMLLTIGGPLLLAVTARLILPASERRGFEAVMSVEDAQKNPNSRWGSVDWRLGPPEVTIPVSLEAGLEVKFRLIRSLTRSAGDNRLQTTGLERLSHPTGTGGHHAPFATLFIGTIAPNKDRPFPTLAAVVQSDENHVEWMDMDFRDWQFAFRLPDELVFSEPGASEYVIATKGKENPETAEQLVLEAVVTEASD